MNLTRRTLLRSGIALAVPAAAVDPLAPLGIGPAHAEEANWRHGLSLFGDLKYPAGFRQFDYVNANAPKAGVVRLSAFGTFDNFNLVVGGVKGSLAGGLDLIHDTR